MNDIVTKLLEEFPSALTYGDEERCGVITADGELLIIANIHRKPVEGFHMEPKSFLAAIEAGATATWHTHPGRDPNLSHEDMDGFRAWPRLTHHILGIRDGEITVETFNVTDDGIVVKA